MIDRRTFVKCSLVGSATLAAFGLGGCAAQGPASPDAASSALQSASSQAASAPSSSPETGSSMPSSPAASSSQPQEAASSATGQAQQAGPAFDLANGTVLLNNGIQMPVLGIGTYILSGAQAEESVYAALMAGTRLVDTARIYGNEDGVGRAIKRAGVPRDEVFLTTKLWTADFANAAAAIDASLQRLDQDYVDLMLLHHEDANDEEAYHAMEDAVDAGKIRCIGISNFYEEGFSRMLGAARTAPAVLQNETHPYFQERSVKEHIAQAGTALESWFPLGGKNDCQTMFADPVIAETASNHGVSPAQALIRWHLQSGNICIPGSSNPDHIWEDARVWDFELTPDEMAAIDALDRNERLAWY